LDGMSPEEFDQYIDNLSMRDQNNALEGMSGIKRLRVGIRHKDEKPPLGQTFDQTMKHGFLRIMWLAGWAWMFFTFGFVGHLIVKFTERRLKESQNTRSGVSA